MPPHSLAFSATTTASAAIDQIDADGRTIAMAGGFGDAGLDGRLPNPCGLGRCRACALSRTFKEADDLIASLGGKISKGFRSLKISGDIQETRRAPYRRRAQLEHSFTHDRGLSTLAPHVFKFCLPWRFWDVAILDVVSSPNLVSLKVPLGIPSDCIVLGSALRDMTSLRSLTIFDMPDQSPFVRVFPFLGLGILSRSQSLRELDLAMTGYNRDEGDLRKFEGSGKTGFVKAPLPGQAFNRIFLELPEDMSEGVSQWYQRSLSDIARSRNDDVIPLLKLSKLRLENFDLLESAFERIIDGRHLRELRLPYSNIDSKAWKSIKSDHLVVMEDLDYQLLTKAFLKFLARQTRLESLGFARPGDEYVGTNYGYWPDSIERRLLVSILRSAPPLGPGTALGKAWLRGENDTATEYPTLQMLLEPKSMENLKRLVLPVCMYDLTEDNIRVMGHKLRSLESLTCGFVYKDPKLQSVFAESFLTEPTKLRRMTLLTLQLPGDWYQDREAETFQPLAFHDFLVALGEKVSNNIRHVRYVESNCEVYYYHRQRPRNGVWWIPMEQGEGEKMVEKDLTPTVNDAAEWVV